MSCFSECAKRYPEAVESLCRAVRNGRLGQSFLIVSESEKTRRDFSIALAQIAGCARHTPEGSPDTNCRYCRTIEQGVNPDFYTLSPVGKMYQIRVGEMNNPEPNTLRALLHSLYLTGTGRKVGVIYEADRMNSEAQNALLKTLEEPPRETTLILCTGNPGVLLPTTCSRCQRIALPDEAGIFRFPGCDELLAALKEAVFTGVNDPVRAELAAQSMIRVADALAAAADAEVGDRFDSALSAAADSGDSALKKRLETRREDEVSGAFMRIRSRFLAVIDSFCSQIFMLSCGITPDQLPHPELLAGLSPLPVTTPARGEAVLKAAEKLRYTLRFNVNLELALRAFALQLALC